MVYRPMSQPEPKITVIARAPECVEAVEIRRRIPTNSHTYYCCWIPSTSGERFWGRQALFNRLTRVLNPTDTRACLELPLRR